MCLPEKHVTLRESKLLVQYVFHRGQKKCITRSNIEIAHIVLFFHDLLCFHFFQSDTLRQAENLHSQRSRKTHKLVLQKPFRETHRICNTHSHRALKIRDFRHTVG